MTDLPPRARPLPVPSRRLSRLARLGGLAGGVIGGVALRGAGELARGRRPDLRGLVLTPGNAARLAGELARMRGAAMKVGQLISMDAGDVLPPELAEVLARLRSEADFMPPRQLRAALDAAWGRGWLKRFETFEVRPLAAASIGQVHRARTRDGRDLAIKVQYPGVRQSIDSDVDNVAALIRMSGLVPGQVDLAPLLAEAKRQLHEEADYAREGRCLARFGALLADAPDYRVPGLHADLTTDSVLAMDYAPGAPVEALAGAPQAERDRAAERLIRLALRELFEFRLMQTDPNFANYRTAADGALVLLDFGATREIDAAVAQRYRALLRAGLAGEDLEPHARALGLFAADTAAHHRAAILRMMGMAFAALDADTAFDFTDRGFADRMRAEGMALGRDGDFWHVPPMDVLFLQRKFAGLYLLCARLGARVHLRPLVAPWL